MKMKWEMNRFNDIIVSIDTIDENPLLFKEELQAAREMWSGESRKTVWLTLSEEKASHIPIAVEAGFSFHHCDEKSLTLTLPLTPTSFVYPYASHYVGVGGVVINEEGALLVVRENYMKNSWKLPGGLVSINEDLQEAGVREVWEETGIRSEFQSLSVIRHRQGWSFGCSDIYFICRLRPLANEIKIDEREIAKAQWYDLEKFLSDPEINPFNREAVRAAANNNALEIGIIPDDTKAWGDYELLIPSSVHTSSTGAS